MIHIVLKVIFRASTLYDKQFDNTCTERLSTNREVPKPRRWTGFYTVTRTGTSYPSTRGTGYRCSCRVVNLAVSEVVHGRGYLQVPGN